MRHPTIATAAIPIMVTVPIIYSMIKLLLLVWFNLGKLNYF
nr:MAG TPA: hypothetical protein [Caudoviricetes sp.]